MTICWASHLLTTFTSSSVSIELFLHGFGYFGNSRVLLSCPMQMLKHQEVEALLTLSRKRLWKSPIDTISSSDGWGGEMAGFHGEKKSWVTPPPGSSSPGCSISHWQWCLPHNPAGRWKNKCAEFHVQLSRERCYKNEEGYGSKWLKTCKSKADFICNKDSRGLLENGSCYFYLVRVFSILYLLILLLAG